MAAVFDRARVIALLWMVLVPGAVYGQSSPDDPVPAGAKRQTLDLNYRVINLILGQSAIAGAVQDLMMKETATEIRIDIAADVLFDFDKAIVKPAAQTALTQLAGVLRDKAQGVVRIEGHTDARGSEAYNLRLSNQRAEAVKAWLMGPGGLKGLTFETRGLGATQPVAPNTKADGSDDPDGRQKNRRVGVVVRKR